MNSLFGIGSYIQTENTASHLRYLEGRKSCLNMLDFRVVSLDSLKDDGMNNLFCYSHNYVATSDF